MEESANLIETAARTFADEARRVLDAHPEVEQIVAYHEGKLTADAEEKLREHLTLCEDCGDLLLDLASFPQLEAPSGTANLPAEEMATRKASLKARIAQQEGGKVIPFAPLPGPSERAVVKARLGLRHYALAATFLGVAFALGFWVAAPPLLGPQANVEVLYLEPTEVRDTDPPSQQVPSSPGQYVLVLASYQTEPSPAYRLEISDAEGQLVWSTDEVQRTHDDTFTLKLPRDFLPEGSYEIRLLGVGDGPPQVLDTYDLRLGLD